MDRDIALGIVRELYGAQPFSVRKALSELIPGLVRKEGKAIKETLKELVVNGGTSCYVNGIHKDEILAWLEKQDKEKFPIERLPGEMKTVSESLGFTTQKECDDYNKMTTDLIMSGDDKVEPKFKVGDYIERKDGLGCHVKIIFVGGNVYGCEKLIYPKDSSPFFELMFENQDEFRISSDFQQAPAWGEEDERMVGRIRGMIESYAFSQSAVDVNGDLCEKKFIDADIWLKSLKQRIGG